MAKLIRVKDDTYSRLKSHSQGYGDTMNSIITRMLDELE